MEFTQEIADLICEKLADGNSMRSILKQAGMPCSSMVYRSLESDAAFREQYTRAREYQADTLFDQIQDIADDGSNDTYIGKNGEEVNQDVLGRSKLRMEARKWMAGKLRPKVYGDKVEHEHKGSVSIIASAVDEAL